MQDVEKLFQTLVGEIERLLNTKSVVGDPIEVGGKTVIPLVSLGFGFGAGSGTGNAPKSKADRDLEGMAGGGGGGGGIKPVGVIVVDDEGVRFDPVKGGTASVLERAVDALASTVNRKRGSDDEPKTGDGE